MLRALHMLPPRALRFRYKIHAHFFLPHLLTVRPSLSLLIRKMASPNYAITSNPSIEFLETQCLIQANSSIAGRHELVLF